MLAEWVGFFYTTYRKAFAAVPCIYLGHIQTLFKADYLYIYRKLTTFGVRATPLVLFDVVAWSPSMFKNMSRRLGPPGC